MKQCKAIAQLDTTTQTILCITFLSNNTQHFMTIFPKVKHYFNISHLANIIIDEALKNGYVISVENENNIINYDIYFIDGCLGNCVRKLFKRA